MKLIGRICRLSLCVMTCSILAAQQAPAPPKAAPPPPPTPAAKAQTPPVAQPQEPENIERMLSIGLFDWLPSGRVGLHAGAKAFLPPPHELNLPGKPYRSYGVVVTIPAKGSSRLEFSYTTLNDNGGLLAPTDLGLFAGNIVQGEPLATTYSLRHLKLSYNFLTYPNPPQDAKLRIKTLWEFHFMQLYPAVTATVTAPDQPLAETQRIMLPAAGLGIEYVPSKHFRMELKGSGMYIPHHPALGDAEGTLVGRIGSVEIFAGGKLLYFRTSPQKETFMSGHLWGPFGGVRWVFK